MFFDYDGVLTLDVTAAASGMNVIYFDDLANDVAGLAQQLSQQYAVPLNRDSR